MLRTLFLATALLTLATAKGAGQSPVRGVRVEADNDAFNFWIPVPRPDHDYTHGGRIVIDADAAPGWGKRLAPRLRPCASAVRAGERCMATRFEVGQKIYTPRRDAESPLPGERPYAGWLYGSATARVLDGESERSLEVEAGVTGPPSLGEAVHTGLHHIVGFWEPQGWRNQLRFEPAVAVRAGIARLLAEPRASGVRVATVAPHLAVGAGNLLAGAQAGIRAQAGYGVPHPWEAGSVPEPKVAAYVLGAVRGEWVAHSLFLDGNTFRPSPRVERIPLVGEYEVGAALRVGGVLAEYRVVTRGREYRTEPDAHRYSTIVIGYRRGY
ncbi:MAG TPA: lipid A deacylase LpxR family protein [Longimicrobiaceae bacterium]|nr:lipid A deacylase LpxR family protein [Longimicrobiaceae bacterium]